MKSIPNKTKTVIFLTLFLMLLSPAAAQIPDIPYTKYILDNGLTLIVHEDHKAPIVAVNVWYHVGSKNERPGKTGFAHLFEHLMFNGSEHFNDDYFQALERVGATDLNGTTSEDRTNYFQNVPTSALDVALWMESDRMGHMLAAIDQAKLDEQRGVVQNEKRQGENQPYGKTWGTIVENSYPAGHPYSWSVIGSMEDIEAASLDDVHEWFKTYYGAGNAILSIAGDITPEAAKAKVEKYFGHIPSGPPVTKHEAWIAKMEGTHRQIMQDRVPQARIYKVWNIPQWGAEEAAYLDLVGDVLSSGKTSRLYKRLVYDDQIATMVNVYLDMKEIGGQLLILADAKEGVPLAQVEEAIDEELEKFLAKGPTKSELERVKTQARASFIRGIERIGGFGGKSDILATNEVYGGSPDYYKKTQAWMADASTKDLRDAARKWLSDGVYILEVHPFPEYATTESTVDRSKLPGTGDMPQLKLPAAQKVTLSNGLKVLLSERHEIPVVDFELILDAGYAADQHHAPGVASMALDMLNGGTKKRSALEISEELSMLGASLGAGSSLDASHVSLSALKENLDASLDIFADVILNPSFPEDDLDRLKIQHLAQIKQEQARPVTMGLRILPRFIFGTDHAYGASITGSGTEETVEAMTRDDMVRFHQTWFQPDNATIVVVGDITMDEAKDQLEAKLGDWEKTGDAPEKNLAEVDLPKKSRVYIIDKPEAQQSVVLAGQVAPPTNNPNEVAIGVMNHILGGSFTSRINMNLREDKHWSYGARSLFWDAQGQRLYLAYTSVQSDKTMETMEEINKEFREYLGKRPATADELEKAQKNRTLRLPGQFETKSSVRGNLSRTVRYGLPEDYMETYAAKVKALTLGDIKATAKDLLHPGSLTWVVIGDRSLIEDKVRSLGYGAVQVIDVEGNPVE